tara:strand:+ start:21 stop:5951 length:5931 start_codon:yes stop_codon:yes gene_type:complete
MGLSRLDNFLKSTRGTILYVDPNSLDATDSIENQGNSLTRPFKTIQRALIEAARFSYQRGLNNDRFAKTTVLLYPGDHIIDNRPGFIPDGSNNYRLRNGSTTNDLPALDLTSNLDLASPTNELYKLNSIHGGVILPRGTSIVGLDLRKTKIRPKYVPDPENDNIERSAVFRITGGCYIWQFSLFDGDPNGVVYKDYTANTFVPNFSHHKLTCFEYADGVNNVSINDIFQTYSTNRTDLQMYYEKVGLIYGQSSGRAIEPDYPSNGLDIQPKVDEFRIVGSTGEEVGISSIRAGDGVTATTTITVTTSSAVTGLDVDTPFRVSDVATGYDGKYVVAEKVSDTEIKYQVQNAPSNALPGVAGATLALSSDTVTSASPYIFNISLRSVFGMCGMEADGSKATGFRSMVVAQFTGIGLQKDDRAFVKYNEDSPSTGTYDDNTVAGNENLSNSSKARYKPEYRNFHVKVSNNSFIQAVSIFAIGFAEHFVTENGGDISLTNSNSNFGANALTSVGFRTDAFSQDNQGYITHIIPPKEVSLAESSIEFESIDVIKTDSVAGVGSTGNLYLLNRTNIDAPPENVIEGYRLGARENDTLKVLISQSGVAQEYAARIVMPDNTDNPTSSAEKVFDVKRNSAGINSIGSASISGLSNVITLTRTHNFITGESVRVISDNGQLPDGLTPNAVAFAVTTAPNAGIGNSELRLAKTLNDAINATTNPNNAITINNKGGALKVASRVSDKNAGDIGHPIQYDTTNSQWYIKVAAAATENSIYPTIVSLGTTDLGSATPRTFFNRRTDARSSLDKTYRMRYVIPSDGAVGRPPTEGFILQESNTSIASTDGEIQTYFGSGSITNVNQQRNFRFIAGASWDGTSSSVDTELPHNLTIGSQVEINNIKSSANTTGAGNSGFNGQFAVTGIGSAKQFSVALATDPGTFSSDTSTRTTALPFFKRKRYANTYYVYRLSESQKYISGIQDGVYYVSVLNASNSPTVAPFEADKYSQPVKSLFPQTSRDTVVSDPEPTVCFAQSNLIGLVDVDDPKHSVTKETLNKINDDKNIGVGITDIFSATGAAHTIHTEYDHGLNRVTQLSIVDGGAGYGSGTEGDIYNARLISIGSSTTGSHATAKLTVNGSGTITDVKVMDGGSAYGIGNTMNVVGVETTGSFQQAVVEVDKIYDNTGDVIRVVGVKSDSYKPYNQLYRITDVKIGAATTVTVAAASSISAGDIAGSATDTGIGVTLTDDAYFYLTGEAINVNTFTYTQNSGIATVTTTNRHGLAVDRKVRIVGAGQTQYNGSFVVTQVNSLTAFEVQLGVATVSPTATGTIFALPEGFTSNNGNVTIEDENLSGRMTATYAGITTTIANGIANATIDQVNIQNIGDLDINIGDYLMVDAELMRVKTTTTGSNPVYVFRGILGSEATSHTINSVIRKVKVDPVELRRHSIIRASGHTFEYVGFGPGNYSTAFPDKQDRAISVDEELLAQSNKREGGINFYTGMNDKGISYSGNKRLSTITGREEIFDTPVETVEGEDISQVPNLNVTTPVELIASRSIKVEGGPDQKVVSKFNGPVIINNKLTVNSTKGFETNNLFIQGDATVSRKHTVGIDTPVLAGNPGDVVYNANPSAGGYVGWIYTTDNAWSRFGSVSAATTASKSIFDTVGIATTSAGECALKVGSGTSLVCADNDGVGIGSTANGFKLRVVGESRFSGSVVATAFTGDGSGLTNLSNDSLFEGVPSGIGTGISPIGALNVGIGTTRPLDDVNLTVGAVGSSGTSLFVHGDANISGILTCNNVFVSGIVTASNFDINNSSTGRITAGIITTGTLHVGTAGTIITTQVGFGSVGIGSTLPTATLDVGGHTKLKTYSEAVASPSISANEITIDLSVAQSFTVTASDDINAFVLTNIPSGSTSFTVKILQDSTGGHSVGIDIFKNISGTSIPVYWPGGGVLPIVTTTADRADIYSFKLFDGDNATSSGLYGVVGGQNFA